MGTLSAAAQIIDVLKYLMPGFLAAWVFYALTTHPQPRTIEKVVQALILTVMIQILMVPARALVLQVADCGIVFGSWTDDSELVLSLIIALSLGMLVACAATHVWFHRLCNGLNITQESGYPSEWFSAFVRNKSFVVLHLDGRRRLYGWPAEWSCSPEKGHIIMKQAEWLNESFGEYERLPLAGVESVLVNVREVEMVEFMEEGKEVEGGEGAE